MLFHFVLTKCSKSELFSGLQKVDHVTNYSIRPIRHVPEVFSKDFKASVSTNINMTMVFDSHANKTHFYKKVCAINLVFKVTVFGTQT